MKTIRTIILTSILLFISTEAFSKEHRFSTSAKAQEIKTLFTEGQSFPVAGSGWGDYRRELLSRLAENCVIPACKTVNPNVRVILKFPCWYDSYQDRGYDPICATKTFDAIWVGTETRDYHWQKKHQKGR